LQIPLLVPAREKEVIMIKILQNSLDYKTLADIIADTCAGKRGDYKHIVIVIL